MDRQNFYQGQSVAPEHLNQLQDFTMQGQANLVATLLGYGIVDGFEIETTEGHVIDVGTGLAFNLQGERLVLVEGKQVNLVEHKPNSGDKTIKLGIILSYEKTEISTDGMGNNVYTKWTPTVEFVIKEILVANEFELAEIVINPVAVVSIIKTATNFGTLPKVEENLLERIQVLTNKTSALTTGDEFATITNPLINLITQNLQINGVPYIEIGSNDNGHYIKFESGLLINLAKITYDTIMDGNIECTFPFVFKDTNYLVDGSIFYFNKPNTIYKEKGRVVNSYLPQIPDAWEYGNTVWLGMFIGFWK